MKKIPIARSVDIVVQELGKETLIYDLKTQKAYSLNETSSIVYRACDGLTSFDDLKKKHRKLTDEIILLAISELDGLNLLGERSESTVGRRELLQKAALSAFALPIIIGLHIPTAAQSRSCLPDGQPCNFNNPGACCSNVCTAGDPTPICFGQKTCAADGQPCSFASPGDCCSGTCVSGSPTPTCTCTPSRGTCNLANPATCCSQICVNSSPTPTCL